SQLPAKPVQWYTLPPLFIPRTGCLRIVPYSRAIQKYAATLLRLPQWLRNHWKVKNASPNNGKV
ncbi:hypothetical protein, partial [Methylocystis sp. MJC1]|uniref:hypothetical protein n=1 Tax=Methylocystis sp. MJC1 TaxID=2654282 RepID=UPI0019D03FA0